MIVGIGMDLVDIARIEKMLGKECELLLQRLLTVRELELVSAFTNGRRRTEWVAGRFAAKEALMKAIGACVSGMIGMLDIEVLADDSGRPIICLSEAVSQRMGFPVSCHLTITHTVSTAGAMIVIER